MCDKHLWLQMLFSPTLDLISQTPDPGPNESTHLDKDEALVPTGWEFAGAISPAWHLGLVLDSWAATPDGEINEIAAKAVMDGYAS